MPNSRRAHALAALAAGMAAATWSALALGQQGPAAAPTAPVAPGFALDRFYPSAPDAAWLVMDDLAMHGGLRGGIALTTGYAYRPFQVKTADGSQHLVAVSDEAIADVGLVVSRDRYRLYLNLTSPLLVTGRGGVVGAYRFVAPSVDLGSRPDLVSDVRLGFDVRAVGGPTAPVRVGMSSQVFAPSGLGSDYDSDGTVRMMDRVLVAGDVGIIAYAAEVGIHLRPRDVSPAPGPRGSELLFGAAAGPRFALGSSATLAVGPEIFGETAFRSYYYRKDTTGVEALLTGRLDTGSPKAPLRIKLGTGGGLNAHFGAPEWRAVLSVEVSSSGVEQAQAP